MPRLPFLLSRALGYGRKPFERRRARLEATVVATHTRRNVEATLAAYNSARAALTVDWQHHRESPGVQDVAYPDAAELAERARQLLPLVRSGAHRYEAASSSVDALRTELLIRLDDARNAAKAARAAGANVPDPLTDERLHAALRCHPEEAQRAQGQAKWDERVARFERSAAGG